MCRRNVPTWFALGVLSICCLATICDRATGGATSAASSSTSATSSSWKLLGDAGRIAEQGGRFILVQNVPPVPQQPLDTGLPPVQPTDVSRLFSTPTFAMTSGAEESVRQAARLVSLASPPPAVEATSAGEIAALPATNLGQVFVESDQLLTVRMRRRSELTFNPYIRGYQGGQIYNQANGAWWLSARRDLGSLITKFDPSLIQDVVIIPGPYGLRFGPGFSFIDVTTVPTPRYQNGPEIHARLGIMPKTNGGQLFGRTTVFGGDSDSGYLFHYGNRSGNDYRAGDGTRIPATYRSQNFMGQIGYDLSPCSTVEFRYNRLDETDVEFAGQFFDLNFLVTDAFGVNYVSAPPDASYTRLKLDAWYNQTRYAGDTDNSSKRSFHVIDRVEAALEDAFGSNDVDFHGDTDGLTTSAGARAVAVYGDDDWTQLSLGADLRYAKQRIGEFFDIVDNNGTNSQSFYTNQPKSDLIDPGLFTELSLPLRDYWTTTLGARIDWVHMRARAGELRPDTSLTGAPADLTQNDVLYAFYLTNNVDISSHWGTRFGFGHAQRFPTLTERYADGVFLGIVQSGFSRVIGDPNLDKERAWQVDATLTADYCRWRGRLSAYHAWIVDYVTYSANIIADPAGARLLRATNTDYATLTGFEAYGEWDMASRLTAFGAIQYIDGRDREIDAPLPAIAPLQSRVGLRLHDPCGGEVWGLELGARILDGQQRLGTLREAVPLPGVVPIEVATPGFATVYLRSYYNVTERLSFIVGINNLFDRRYLEHLDHRLPADPVHGIPATEVLSPGISPYAGVEWTY